MKRREFSITLAAAAAGAALAPAARAQGGPIEGQHYVKLAQPVPQATPGKIDVIEFFWYGCPHCNALEPFLETWWKRLPPDVAARRVPVGFLPMHQTHQRLFYALEAMDLLPTMHRKVFTAIHVDRKRLDKDADIIAFVAANGVDAEKFGPLLTSFSVATKARQAKQLSEAYRIDGVPTLGVGGKYFTSPAMAGGPERALAATDYLIALARRG